MAHILRYQFRAQVQHGSGGAIVDLVRDKHREIEQKCENCKVLFLKLFKFEDQIFVYLESERRNLQFDLPSSVNELLLDWPGAQGARKIVPMLDIFHDAIPRSESVWRPVDVNRESVCSIVYLRPEKYCSYVFYHFQLQEEGLRKFNKYYLIGAHENCLVSYQENPAIVDKTNYDRILKSNSSPENWAEIMSEHFQPWRDASDLGQTWKPMAEIYCFTSVR